MWNEPTEGVAESLIHPGSAGSIPMPAVVASVEPGSIGEELGFEPGDKLLTINGIRPRDLIDYQFLVAEEELSLKVLDQTGKEHQKKNWKREKNYMTSATPKNEEILKEKFKGS